MTSYQPKTIGILGGGQLGKMLAISASHLGYKTIVFSPEKTSIAFSVASESVVASFQDSKALENFFNRCDVVTYEFENIVLPKLSNAYLNKLKPSINILEISQDRIKEKTFLNSIKVKTASFKQIKSLSDAIDFINKNGKSIIKTATLGYDGKGQWVCHKNNIQKLNLNFSNTTYIIEQKVDFITESSAIIARNANGEMAVFPISQNTHIDGILAKTIAPAKISASVLKKINKIASIIAEKLGLEGILAVEFFITKKGEVLVNELAPRPHNSGHWTMDGSITSQFEQTIRAILNLPLGSTKIKSPKATVEMINILGDDINNLEKYYKNPKAKIYIYGKENNKNSQKRKLGHINLL